MKNVPDPETIKTKIIEIIEENVELNTPLKTDAALVKELGFDSLDLIETSFCLQEFFGFEFSDKNAIEELENALGNETILSQGRLTELGRSIILLRMPELERVNLPQGLTPMELQQYYTVETFVRLIHEFYLAAPDTCPESGEPVVLNQFRIQTQSSGKQVEPPGGDTLIDRWVAETAASLQQV